MKQQVIFVHGGESKDNYESYIDFLGQFKYKPFEIKKKWKMTLAGDLGSEYELLDFTMPNKGFADYNEWKIMFEKSYDYISEGVILIGHSLGGSFLTKYLNENNFPVKPKKIILIASAFKDSQTEVLGNFNSDHSLSNMKKYEDIIVFFHSRDDTIVPFDDLEDYRNIFSNSEYKIYDDKFHFVDEKFPELISYIKKINK